MRLYLASTSPARLALLRSSGIEPVLLPSGVDEEAAALAASPADTAALVSLLAQAKAEAVVAAPPDGVVIDGLVLGGDSAFELDGVAYGKPHEAAVARERWMAQRGRTGRLYSGHWLIRCEDGTPVAAVGAVAVATVRFVSDITDAEIDAYIASGEPLQVAGAFTIDSLGAPFIDHIDGDPSTVVGLSLPTLRRLARDLGVEWPSLWNRRGAIS